MKQGKLKFGYNMLLYCLEFVSLLGFRITLHNLQSQLENIIFKINRFYL